MSQALEQLAEGLSARYVGKLVRIASRCGELTFELAPDSLLDVCTGLRDDPDWRFEQLIDLTGVDYLDFGHVEWNAETATSSGFSRAKDALTRPAGDLSQQAGRGDDSRVAGERRFAVVYHLMSVRRNLRLRLRAWCEAGEPPLLDSVTGLWKSADWYEREAFDLFGIVFRGHPDLRRILTDYGFVGHPFRRDFPLSGNVEVRYDPSKGRVVYEPVSIEPRTLVPRVIREDHRYEAALKDAHKDAPKHG